ncbi:hypothetical protein B0J14DRAFT_269138 [Halenospora varia]|nr:hypothetical protein B0J14DRAFT_269138 [Halenospora varia]
MFLARWMTGQSCQQKTLQQHQLHQDHRHQQTRQTQQIPLMRRQLRPHLLRRPLLRAAMANRRPKQFLDRSLLFQKLNLMLPVIRALLIQMLLLRMPKRKRRKLRKSLKKIGISTMMALGLLTIAKAAELAKKAVEEAEAAAEKAKLDLERAETQVVEVPVEAVVVPGEEAAQPPPQPPIEIPVESVPAPATEQVTEQATEQPPQPPTEEEKSKDVAMEGVEATPSPPTPENPPAGEAEPAPPKGEETTKEDVVMEETPEPEIPEPEISPELKARRHTHRSLLVSDAHFTCQICHSPYFSHRPQNGPERPVTTPCHHIAGVACLEEWMEGRDRPGCPFCRQPLIFGCNHKIAHHNAFEKSTPKKIGAGEIMKECYDCGMEKINGKWERAEMLARDARRNAQAALQSAEVRVQDMGSLTPEDEKRRWIVLRDLYQQSVTMSEEVREKDRVQREAETKAFKEPLKGTWCKVYGSRYPDESEDEESQDEDNENENERDDQSDSSDSDSDDGHANNSARRGGRGGFRGRGRGGRGRGGGW